MMSTFLPTFLLVGRQAPGVARRAGQGRKPPKAVSAHGALSLDAPEHDATLRKPDEEKLSDGTAVRRPQSADRRTLTAVRRPPTAVRRPPSADRCPLIAER